MPEVTKLRKEDPALTFCLSGCEACALRPGTQSASLRGRALWFSTKRRSVQDLVRLLAAELHSWTWSRGEWYLGVRALHHPGAHLQTPKTVVEPPGRPGPPAGTLGRETCLPLLRQLSSGEPAGLSTRQGSAAGRRKEGRQRAGKEGGGGAHRAGKAGPNLAVSYFRTVPWDLGPEILGEGSLAVQMLLIHVSSGSHQLLLADRAEAGEKAGHLALVPGDGSVSSEPGRVCGCWWQ